MILLSLAVLCVVVAPVSIVTRNLDSTPAVVAVHGSLRTGRAELQGGYQLNWNSHAEVFGLPHLATDFTIEGNDTRIVGQLQTGARGVVLHEMSGRAGPGLAQLVPGAWACDMTARVADVSFRWGWRRTAASGEITTPEGDCRKTGQTITMPPLTLTLSSERDAALLTLRAEQTEPLATVRVHRDRLLDVAIQPDAADVFPQLPRGGPISLQLPF